ncbi:hypothetical protein D9757_000369 [Collybiopsis confluens]|uniref:Uncharacterized protein n=1 Tax=Collybiopsis confluens TaxID=2823264 RepID=A0A8H5I396_9AGAR|nr:hypothetical protein D9757_000369 [Collybiopsis confluens]
MPRIRKKTSKRGTTNDRRKISQKVRESRKKKTKAAKKNVEWKSKHKKDPGIPNTFPYKDQILAEVAEQRRLAAEEKQRKKDEKRGLKASTTQSDGAQVLETGDAQNDGEFDGIASISAKRLTAKAMSKPTAQVDDDEDEDEEEPPMLINTDLPNLHAVLNEADVIIEVLDARDPLAFRSEYLEKEVASKQKKVMLVVNKIDCAPQESVTAWIAVLRGQHPTFPFRSASPFVPGNSLTPTESKGKGKGKDVLDDALGVDPILACLNRWANEKTGDEPLAVAVVGVTNAGKSTFINSLVKKRVLRVYTLASSSRGPTTTTIPQEITTEVEGKTLRFIDTPGLTWESDRTSSEANQVRYRDILMRNKGRIDRLKDPLGPITHLVSRANSEDLMILYSLPAFPKGDVDAFISGVARSQQLVRKRGALDLSGASKVVLRDWCAGKIRWYTAPPSSDDSAEVDNVVPESWLQSLYDKADVAVAGLEIRKTMRKIGGLVRLSPGRLEGRTVLMDLVYADSGDNSDEDEDDSDGGKDLDEDLGQDDDEVDEDEDDDDEESGEEERAGEEGEYEERDIPEPSSASRSQKRKRNIKVPLPPNKKVTFAPESRGSKGKSFSKRSTKVSATKITHVKRGGRPSPKKVK